MRIEAPIAFFRNRFISYLGCLFFIFLFLGESFHQFVEFETDTIELTQSAEEAEKEKEKEKESEEENVKMYWMPSRVRMLDSKESETAHFRIRFIPTNLREIETPPPESLA